MDDSMCMHVYTCMYLLVVNYDLFKRQEGNSCFQKIVKKKKKKKATGRTDLCKKIWWNVRKRMQLISVNVLMLLKQIKKWMNK